MQHNAPYIIFISGASGAGKTTLMQSLKTEERSDRIKFFHFDTIGVPSEEEMVRQYGSPKLWQKEMTFRWIKKIVGTCEKSQIAIIEGQTELTFIKAAFQSYGVESYTILLIHCENKVRHRRLEVERAQPDLINHDMDNWAHYLYQQAREMHIKILDTSANEMLPIINQLRDIIHSPPFKKVQ